MKGLQYLRYIKYIHLVIYAFELVKKAREDGKITTDEVLDIVQKLLVEAGLTVPIVDNDGNQVR